jgi:hypothetical protein
MKKTITFVCTFICTVNYFAQFGDLQINLRFDNVYSEIYGQIYNINSNNNNIFDQGQLTWDKSKLYEQGTYELGYSQASIETQNRIGSERSSSLEALLRMYESTCDMKYIWEFMEQSSQIISCRADKVSPQQSSAPYLFTVRVPWHGRILFPLAHFVYLVQNKNLSSISIPVNHRSNFLNKQTIGQFSNYVNTQNREMMDSLLTKYWRNNDECMCKPKSISEPSSCKTKIGPDAISDLNFQAPYGCALIYMYLANTNEISYGVKVVEMARAYLFSNGTVLTPYTIGGYTSYGWSHTGWQKNKKGQLRNEYFEDIAHGAHDIIFPILYNKFYYNFYPYVTGGQYFEDYQLVRFRNTFIRNISNSISSTCSNLQQSFNCNVVGTCFGHYGSQSYLSYQMNAKNWMGLYVYDNVPGAIPGNSIYSILMNYYITTENCIPINQNNYSGISIIGLADMVVANREKEGLGCIQIGIPNNPSSKPESSSSIFPNPSKESISVSSNFEIKLISIYDLEGKLILSVNNNYNNILVSHLKEGVYIVNIQYLNGENEIKKLFLE